VIARRRGREVPGDLFRVELPSPPQAEGPTLAPRLGMTTNDIGALYGAPLIQTGGFAARDCGKQTELARRTFDAVVKNTRDIAELVQKSSNDATTIIMNRIRESIAEARAAIETKKT
jgi:hypothetical protein